MTAAEWLCLLGLSLLWGMSFFFVELAIPSFAPFTLVFLRVGSAALLMLLYLRLRRAPVARLFARWRDYAFTGFFGSALPFVCFAWGQRYIDSGLASVLNALTPLCVLIIALMLGREKFSAARACGIVLGVGGVAVLTDPGAATALFGALAGVLAAVSYGISTNYAWGRVRERAPAENTCGQLIFASLFLLPLSLLERPWQAAITPSAAAAVLCLGVLSTFFAYLLYYRLLRGGAVNSMLAVLLIPVFAITLGVVFLGEEVGDDFFIGSAMIFAGLIFTDKNLRSLPARLLRRKG